MNIRKLNAGDIPDLAKLNVKVFGDTTKEQALKVFTDSFQKRIPDACLVAEEDGTIIGAIMAEISITFSPETAHIKSLFVMEGYQGKGIGNTLLENCLTALKEAGVKEVSLTADPGNKNAISLYEKMGFGLFRLEFRKRL